MCLGTDRATERASERAARGEHTFRVFVKQPASLLESSPFLSLLSPSSSLYLSLVKSMNAIWYGHGRRLALYIGSKTNHTRSAKVRTCGRSKHAVHGGRHRPNIKQARRGRQGGGRALGRAGWQEDRLEGGRKGLCSFDYFALLVRPPTLAFPLPSLPPLFHLMGFLFTYLRLLIVRKGGEGERWRAALILCLSPPSLS